MKSYKPATSSRGLDPVEPVELPSRLSQTLLRLFDTCKRSGYLYVKHKGGGPSHAMDRGTAFHLFAERAVNLLLEQEEDRLPPELAKDLMLEVVREHPELTLPASEQDGLRVMAYHWAEGVRIDPARVVAVEQKFALDIGGQRVIGKIDFASISEDGTEAEIIDYKTSLAMTPESELSTKLPDGRRAAKAAQLLIYAVLFAHGQPEGADGKLDLPLGGRVNTFRCSEAYPRFLFDDGIGMRSAVVARGELPDHLGWLEGLVADISGRFEDWEFPAVDGSHCDICPARSECPLPTRLKSYRGEINSAEQAAEAASKLRFDDADVKARRKELKGWADHNGPVRYGSDRVMDFGPQSSRKTDWPALVGAVERAVEYGEPFVLEEHAPVRTSTRFRDRKLEPHELEDGER